MKLSKFIYTTLFFLIAISINLSAQVTKPTEKPKEDKVANEEIEVVRPYKPILAEAVKLRRSPDLNNLKTYKAKFNYTITDRKLELNTDIQKLQAQQLADEKLGILVNNYVKGGLGSLTTTLAEVYVNNGKDEALQTGMFFKHFSQQGTLLRQNANQQQLNIFGKSIGNNNTLSGNLNFERNGLNFFGFDPANPTLNPNPAKQVLNYIALEGEIVNKFTEDENSLNYAAKVNGYLFSDKFNAKENAINLNGYLNKRIGTFNLGLASAVELGNTKGLNTNFSNNIFRLNPYLKFQTKGVNIVAGINLVQEFGDKSASRIFPAVTLDFTLITDFLQFFIELKGDVNRNTLKAFTDENPFLNADINIKNTVEKVSFTAGIKGNGGPGFGYKASIYSKKITDMPLFVNNFNSFNKFDVIYDFGDMQLLGIAGEIAVQISNDLNWTGKINIEQYKPAVESFSWFKPTVRLSSNLLYNINKKLAFNANLTAQDDSRAKTYTAAPANQYLIPNPAIETLNTIKGFVDLGVGADYKINTKFSAFAKANNLFNNSYSKYLFYQVNKFNIFGGVTYSF